jgi:non-specific serine/threonine protein kinase
VVHPSAAPAKARTTDGADNLAEVDLVITSYGFLARAPWLETTPWRLVVLDEAQAIKNPAAKQTKTVKQLRADTRIALTASPIENRLSDLWSIFDFINPGLLGSSKEFSSFVKHLADRPHNPYGPRTAINPGYFLIYSHPRSPNAERSTPDGAYHPAEP